MNPIENFFAEAPRNQHTMLQRVGQICASRLVGRTQLFDQVAGPHDQCFDPPSTGELSQIHNPSRRLNHQPQRLVCATRCIHHCDNFIDLNNAFDLGEQQRRNRLPGKRRDIIRAPVRVQPVATYHQLAMAIGVARDRGEHLLTGLFLGIRRHCVFKVENDRIAIQRSGLLHGPRVGAGHIQ